MGGLYYLLYCPGARPIIAVGTILPILIMSWPAVFARVNLSFFWHIEMWHAEDVC